MFIVKWYAYIYIHIFTYASTFVNDPKGYCEGNDVILFFLLSDYINIFLFRSFSNGKITVLDTCRKYRMILWIQMLFRDIINAVITHRSLEGI